jgi:GAF domain-containing protein
LENLVHPQYHRDRMAAALTEAAKALHTVRTLEETLDAIVRAAQHTVPGFDHVGISITHKDGSIETKAGTGQLVWELDAVQYGLGQGPCFDAIHAHPVMFMEDSHQEQRWPDYIPRAAEKGVRSQMGLRLYTDERTLGGLNFYSTEGPGVDPEALQIGELFATHAALALGRSRYEHELAEAVVSRQLIGTAIGIIMQQFQITEDRAFQFLARASMTSNVKLRTLAEEVCMTANERFARTAQEPPTEAVV